MESHSDAPWKFTTGPASAALAPSGRWPGDAAGWGLLHGLSRDSSRSRSRHLKQGRFICPGRDESAATP